MFNLNLLINKRSTYLKKLTQNFKI